MLNIVEIVGRRNIIPSQGFHVYSYKYVDGLCGEIKQAVSSLDYLCENVANVERLVEMINENDAEHHILEVRDTIQTLNEDDGTRHISYVGYPDCFSATLENPIAFE